MSSMSLVKAMLHLEGLAVLLAAGWLYLFELDAAWVALVVLLLAPDLAALGYLRGERVGAALYNAAHSYLGVVGVLVLGVAAGEEGVTAIGLIWAMHIGMDRLMGYGLKFPTGFKHTHLQRLAAAPQPSQSPQSPQPRQAPLDSPSSEPPGAPQTGEAPA